MPGHVVLEPLDEALLTDLLHTAVADAHPGEVMPVEAPDASWNADREAGFRAFHRGRALTDPPVESTYGIRVDGEVVGAARLCRLPASEDTAEAGVWIGRSRRGTGIGTAVFAALIERAAAEGYSRLFVSTTPDNIPVLRLLTARGIDYALHDNEATAWIRCG
ncbi:GNAT family N-acetyltransferase [Nocardia sp. CDC186]|uniref:GNAT family N-acetyltransferase n=1 Tax=Nocardia implantans TaxID=3108168 RepID=A0ABU6AZ44_9NOCA|nr:MULTISPECIES: GNAT family N-acetyltransferase [unclassified Nocardia]MEA3529950.1 GNAT family N-acetyltransferase [Nocardia sp. CDC192]MEB3512572.1 GNAT family N-acetyltransferase [Nocardia sp. CDC186]